MTIFAGETSARAPDRRREIATNALLVCQEKALADEQKKAQSNFFFVR
jgi:hypothetical protein